MDIAALATEQLEIRLFPNIEHCNDIHILRNCLISMCIRVTSLPVSCGECSVICSLNRPEPSGPHRPVIGIAFFLTSIY